jgi:hypothetical protein
MDYDGIVRLDSVLALQLIAQAVGIGYVTDHCDDLYCDTPLSGSAITPANKYRPRPCRLYTI